MAQYLVKVAKSKHYTTAHLLAPDGVTALCRYKETLREGKSWPRVSDEWQIKADYGDLDLCSFCREITRPKPEPAIAPNSRVGKQMRDLEKLRKWNENSRTRNRAKGE